MSPPTVLCFSGLDPTGGAGIQADIQTLSLIGCHPCPIVTCLTVQDSHNVRLLQPISPEVLFQQVSCVLKDIPINILKVGLLPDKTTIVCLHKIIQANPSIKLILDPISHAGGGSELMTQSTQTLLKTLIFPNTHLITPNLTEAQELANLSTQDSSAIAQTLLDQGCKNVLITDTQPDTPQVTLELWQPNQGCIHYSSERLAHTYHGTGCTLTSAIAGYLAKGFALTQVIQQAINVTEKSLKNAYALGSGQAFPNRLP